MDRKQVLDSWGDGKKISKEQQQIGVVSSMLCSNIARPIQTTIPFEEFNIKEREYALQGMKSRGGKLVSFTYSQEKIVFALSQVVTMHRNEERMRKYIECLTQNILPNDSMTFVIDIKALTKKINPLTKISQREIDDVEKDLNALIETRQVFFDGVNYSTFPIFANKGDHRKMGKDGKTHLERIALEFCPMFFLGLDKRYAVLPYNLFEIWGQKGTRTDLFFNLLCQLLSVYGNHHSAYEVITRKIRLENTTRKAEEVDIMVAKAQKEALMYSELSATIQSRTTTDYNSSRAMKKKFYTDLQNACDAFKKLKIITDYKKVLSKNGERWDFWFNPDYNKAVEAELIEG